jgi:predicted DNA-binding antitoxin AbrB/MazE fold protein
MPQTASAIYENGVLRPTSLLSDLREGQRVQITIEMIGELTVEETAQRRSEVAAPHGSRGRLGPLSAPGRTPSRRLATFDN